MRKLISFAIVALFISLGGSFLNAQKKATDKTNTVLFFNPEVEPDIEEIKEPTNQAFFTAVSDNLSERKSRMIKTETQVSFDSIDKDTVFEYSSNNNADFVVVPKVKYFKVGLGKYVFSNQVVVSMKLFDANGNFLTEASYDTYRKNMRLLGSTVNSVKIGTNGVIREIIKNLKKAP